MIWLSKGNPASSAAISNPTILLFENTLTKLTVSKLCFSEKCLSVHKINPTSIPDFEDSNFVFLLIISTTSLGESPLFICKSGATELQHILHYLLLTDQINPQQQFLNASWFA